MPLVKYSELGRDNLTYEKEIPDTEPETIAMHGRRGLMSSDVSAVNGMILVGGFRPVGKYEILEA